MAKELTWRGKTEQELRRMDLKEFMQLVKSRQRRALKRGFTDAEKRLLQRVQHREKTIRTHCRDMIIIPAFLGKNFKIHNGKEFIPLDVTVEMLGHRLGEFAQTRKGVTHSAAGIGATRSSKAVSAR